MHVLGEEREHDPVRLLGAQLNRRQSGLLLGPEQRCVSTRPGLVPFLFRTVTVNCLFEG